MIIWEELEKSYLVNGQIKPSLYPIRRAKVPGGWLVRTSSAEGAGICFYPDPQHKWDGSSLP
jgi:hypothetical protein